MTTHPVLVNGQWQAANAVGTFSATNPNTNSALDDVYPVSEWSDVEQCLDAAAAAATELRQMPGEKVATFLETFADRIEARADELVAMAHLETALPASPRLKDVELPRTCGQLRQAAQAARTSSWRQATIDTNANIRSGFLGLGPVAVFGPNNFPFAFGSVSGGDFAAAIAAGNPVIGKANSSHPGTTRLFAEEAIAAVEQCGMPAATVQLLYRIGHADGERLAADPRLAAIGYTGSRSAGLKLKEAADRVGKPAYLELSSINPVVVMPGALEERLDALVDEFAGSCLMGAGQFCTNPGLVVMLEGDTASKWIDGVAKKFDAAPAGTLLGPGVQTGLVKAIGQLEQAGATTVTAGGEPETNRCAVPNALLTVSGAQFLENAEELQTEAFGNESLVVTCADLAQLVEVLGHLEGNLTGCIYSANDGRDNQDYAAIESVLRTKVGRLLNDKMPTGVAVSPAMNHGGPFPATGHPGFTAVGIPASIVRFGMLASYDAVRPDRLPVWLQDKPAHPEQWRWVDGQAMQGEVSTS